MERRDFLKNGLLASGSLIISSDLIKAESSYPDLLIEVNVNKKGTAYTPFWRKCVGAGRANEGLRASWLEHLQLSREHGGFEYCRFHGLFHDDMFVYREQNGQAHYNWQYIDDLFDRMLEIGVKPFVELGFSPAAMASDPDALQFWWKGNVSPPKDYMKWKELVKKFVQHCIDRYELDEVLTWYFEVWNEPNLWGFWQATKAQYFELYKVSVQTIKEIDERLKVGGPSTSNFVPDDRFAGEKEDKSKHKTLSVKNINNLEWKGVWIEDFLQYCKTEDLPMDFISCHPYPTDWALDPMTGKGGGRVRQVNATRIDLEWLNKTVKNSAYPNAEIHLTEWSTSPSSRDAMHDSLEAASFVIKANLDCIGLTDSLSYWVFTDVFEEKGGGDTIWHGGFGLINFQGIVKPTFHAYRMLNQLGTQILHREEGIIVTKHADTEKIIALLYHYPTEIKDVVAGATSSLLDKGTSRKVSLTFKDIKFKTSFEIDTLYKDSGFAYLKWEEMGRPEPPTREQAKALKTFALNTKKEIRSASGIFTFNYTLKPWECILITEK